MRFRSVAMKERKERIIRLVNMLFPPNLLYCAGSKDKRKHAPVNRIMLPTPTLLHTDPPPFVFRKKSILGQRFGQILGKNHMP